MRFGFAVTVSMMLPVALVACSGGADGDDGGGTTDPADRFAEFVNVDQPASGTFDCFTPSADPATIAWLTSSADPANQQALPVNGFVEDFEEGTAVAGATVALFTDDAVGGTPDVTGTSDVNGTIALSDGGACDPLTYRVTTEGGPTLTKTTYKAHQIYGAAAGAAVEGASFVSVSDVTYQLIPAILGIEVKSDLAIIAGTAYDCGRDPSQDSDDPAGKIEGAQVVVLDADGNIPDTLQVNYFVESFPARDQKFTSADGLWVAANVPPGDLEVQMWGQVDGELVLLGASKITSEADSINIANVFAGYGDGVKYPSTCLAAR
ncbi:MAG: hypothetical protein ABMB14_13865 [Myxococcota bacterium]